VYTCIGIVPGLVLMLSERERDRQGERREERERGVRGARGVLALLCEENFKMLKSLMIKKKINLKL